ncbi:cell wall-binding repeat-containing protein [Mobiluncus mulieris]|uniref:cell wall-binding repeat-containing protein n=1 Tax=Mobiluncus mulieris TaxID=2052 RepID=UPI002432C6C7|nr:cell wall-binding repeat-containing protein [Mobiluncus mulieris]
MLHANIRLKAPVATVAASITAFTLTLTGIPAAVASTAIANTISDTIKTLKASNITVLGGQNAIPDAGVKEVTSLPFIRLPGMDRYDTAEMTVQNAFQSRFNPQGRVVKKVYVARGDNPADALAASNLKDGALLLAPPRLNENTYGSSAVIGFAASSIGATSVTILGGGNAVEDKVVNNGLGNINLKLPVNRIYGANRYETAALIAKQAYPNGVSKVYLARGDQPADALAASNLKDGALLLAPPTLDNPSATTTVSNAIKELRADSVTVLGGQGALPDQVVSAITSLPTNRVAGSDRYETAALIAKQAWPNGTSKIYLARGDQPADALAASNLKDGALLLAPPNLATQEMVEELNRTRNERKTFTVKSRAELDLDAINNHFLKLLNEARTQVGSAPVTINPTAVKFALAQVDKPDSGRHSTRAEQLQWDSRLFGENIGGVAIHRDDYVNSDKDINQLIAEKAYQGWKDSPAHNMWMLNPNVTAIGLGIGEPDKTNNDEEFFVYTADGALALWGKDPQTNNWDDPLSKELLKQLKKWY